MRCDETTPACTRCSSTGRKCDGYSRLPDQSPCESEKKATAVARMPGRKHTALRILPNPSDTLRCTQTEGRFFDFFLINTSIELAGPLQDDFWTQLVLQVSHREDSVRYMVFALSTLHQSITSPRPATFTAEAVRYYALGLRALNHHIVSNEGAALDVTLLCSILCVTFEWLRGFHHGAEIHLKAGMKLLEQWHVAARCPGTSTRTSFWSPSGHLIRSTLSPAYTRLYLQAQSLLQDKGLPLPPPDESSARNPKQPFSNFHEARDSLYEILCNAYSFRRLFEKEKLKKKDRRALGTQQRRTPPFQAVAQWSANLDELFERLPHLKQQLGALVLRIWLTTITIMISVKDSEDETDFDRFTPLFTDIIDLTERLYQRQVSFFCADISIVAILYYVGVKCRHPLIRRRAISLLSSTQRREGIWDSAGAAKVSREILEIEESRANDKVLVETDLKRDARIRGFSVILDDDNHTWTLHSREPPPRRNNQCQIIHLVGLL